MLKHLLLGVVLLSTTLLHAQSGISKLSIIHGPYLQNVEAEEATIVWITDKPSIGWVEVAPDDDSHFYTEERPRHFNVTNGIKSISTIHAVQLKGLTPGTRYRYRIFSQEVLKHVGHKIMYGDYASSDVYNRKPFTFSTLNPQAPTTSFAVVNDIHGDNELLEKLISHCDLAQTDFLLFNGDMASFINSQEQIFSSFMNTATRLFASQIPFYYARGNHETRGAYASKFQHYFSPRQQRLYYAFRQGPVCCVVLDTGEDKPDSDIEYAGITLFDTYRTEQAEWLAHLLKSKEYQEAPFKVIIAHIPPIITETDPEENWHGNREVEQKFISLLRQTPPDLMLCGHVHSFVHLSATPQTPFPIIVNSNTSLLRVQATSNKMQVEVTDRSGKTVDKFSITK